jgi:hypothetical protein
MTGRHTRHIVLVLFVIVVLRALGYAQANY